MFGIEFEDGLAAAVGGYLAKNLGSLFQRFLPGVFGQVDRVRPGLSQGVAELAGAAGVHWASGQFARSYRAAATLGASAVALSDTVSAVFGQVHLLAGEPAFGTGLFGGGMRPTLPTAATTGALPAPGASGTQGVAVPANISLLGYGNYGY